MTEQTWGPFTIAGHTAGRGSTRTTVLGYVTRQTALMLGTCGQQTRVSVVALIARNVCVSMWCGSRSRACLRDSLELAPSFLGSERECDRRGVLRPRRSLSPVLWPAASPVSPGWCHLMCPHWRSLAQCWRVPCDRDTPRAPFWCGVRSRVITAMSCEDDV